jgi:TRAP-type mannitol/chloroaromatic compound transport system permease small subunit
MRNMIAGIADGIDRLIAAAGRLATWCSLYVVIAEFAVVAMRYLFGLGSIRLQESVLYADAALVMLAAAWVLQVNGHVRVDIFYTRAALRTRALIDLFGAIVFLLPLVVVLLLVAVPYMERSWSVFEGSPQPSGLPYVYLLKTLIPLFAVLVGLQGLAQAIRAALSLSGSLRRPSH